MSDIRVVVATPVWSLNGPNVFAENLVRSLRALDVESHIVITRPDWADAKPLPPPDDLGIEKLPVSRYASLRSRWRTMIRYLEGFAPCVYIPNYDFTHSCISPRLSERVRIVGIVHSDDPQHYEHVARLGCYWDAIVAVSPTIARRTAALNPTFEPRVAVIPYGVKVAEVLPEKKSENDSVLSIVYAGRLVQSQKRILDLPRIVRALRDRNVAVHLTVVGSGTEQGLLMKTCAELGVQEEITFSGTLSNSNLMDVMAQSHAVILTSEFEGLPLSLLEAMGQGCVPVVTDIQSGIPELIRDGVNGYRIRVGDIETFSDRLALLHRNPAFRREMAAKAYNTVCSGRYRTKDMATTYLALFREVSEKSERGTFRRPAASIQPPPLPWPEYLPGVVQRVGHAGKRLLADMKS